MASQSVPFVAKNGLFGSAIARRSTSNFKAFVVVTRRFLQSESNSQDLAKRGAHEALRAGENLKNQASSTAEHMADSAKETTQSVAEKAKQTAQGAWESAKEGAHKTKDNVLSKADDAKECVKETADRNMNTKKCPDS